MKINFLANSCLKSWEEFFNQEINQLYFQNLWQKVQNFYEKDMLLPQSQQIFNALELVKLDEVKVIIIGQDPYHNLGQANGLAFAVNEGMPLPGSLINIFKEINLEYGKVNTKSNLLTWANQGVLLLNSILTVIKHQPLSCKDWGWEKFTLNLLKYILNNNSHIVIICFGRYAKQFVQDLVCMQQHYFLFCTHPSPLSAHNGFFHSHVFQKANDYLSSKRKEPIKW